MGFSTTELMIVLAIVVLLFGAKKIPELAKGMGKGIKSFKNEMKEEETASTEEKTEEIEKKEQTATSENVEETKKA
jgi:sec-independent protein translocase protein TatA